VSAGVPRSHRRPTTDDYTMETRARPTPAVTSWVETTAALDARHRAPVMFHRSEFHVPLTCKQPCNLLGCAELAAAPAPSVHGRAQLGSATPSRFALAMSQTARERPRALGSTAGCSSSTTTRTVASGGAEVRSHAAIPLPAASPSYATSPLLHSGRGIARESHALGFDRLV
jgi:hypothetical protein